MVQDLESLKEQLVRPPFSTHPCFSASLSSSVEWVHLHISKDSEVQTEGKHTRVCARTHTETSILLISQEKKKLGVVRESLTF